MKKAVCCLFLGCIAFVACQQADKKSTPSVMEKQKEVQKEAAEPKKKAESLKETSEVEVKAEEAKQVVQEVPSPAAAPVEAVKQEPITSNTTPEQK